MSSKLLIIGAGALTRELILAIPGSVLVSSSQDIEVTVVSRDPKRAEWLCLLGETRARAMNVAMSFSNIELTWDSDQNLADLVGAIQPNVILNTASLQSAWSLGNDDAWSRMVEVGGYGVTAAFQAALLPRLGRAIKASSFDGVFINACYPDLINSGAEALGLDITCGLGNVSLLAALLQKELCSHSEPLRLLAGHWDVNEFCRPKFERRKLPLVWLGQNQLEAKELQGCQPLSGDSSMNALSASGTADMLCAFLTNQSILNFHVPGPLGLPGGYPVCLKKGSLLLDLPPNITIQEAVSWNYERSLLDGATIKNGSQLIFSPPTSQLLAHFAPQLSDGFDFGSVEDVVEDFLELRRHLKSQPASIVESRMVK